MAGFFIQYLNCIRNNFICIKTRCTLIFNISHIEGHGVALLGYKHII